MTRSRRAGGRWWLYWQQERGRGCCEGQADGAYRWGIESSIECKRGEQGQHELLAILAAHLAFREAQQLTYSDPDSGKLTAYGVHLPRASQTAVPPLPYLL